MYREDLENGVILKHEAEEREHAYEEDYEDRQLDYIAMTIRRTNGKLYLLEASWDNDFGKYLTEATEIEGRFGEPIGVPFQDALTYEELVKLIMEGL